MSVPVPSKERKTGSYLRCKVINSQNNCLPSRKPLPFPPPSIPLPLEHFSFLYLPAKALSTGTFFLQVSLVGS